MFETILEITDWDITPKAASLALALALGLAFGILAERTKFCFRSALIGAQRRSSMGVWLMALAFAVLGTQAAIWFELITFDEHRFYTSDLPILAILAGGVMFGAGMVLTRGCASRLTVLAGTGNLRALFVMIVFAITAHAALKGVLAPVRTALGSLTLDLGELTGFAALPGGALFWSALIAAAALVTAFRSSAARGTLILAALLGLLVPLAWVGTGFVLFDEFDPIALESLSFTSPMADSLFWSVASSSIPAGFGTGLIGGTLAGALIASLIFRTFQWQSFETPQQTGRYIGGGVLMGLGGVLAGGCTVGAGLAGIPTLSFAALLALLAIAAGAVAANALLNRGSSFAGGAPKATQSILPAE
ncbi:MAG: YeeE/YedE family protein [Planktotalea sp.]|uniref:YeeE/YedE family protein n=1 Tax=Planktotalea sp. TaxID=2029877 RepID=UPI003C786AB5